MSLPVLAADPDQIERAADPVAYVILACERAKAWLADALEHGQIEDIVELKSQAEAVRVYTAQKQIGKDAELSAAEIVRRAERGIGVAIRRGQEAGEIRPPSKTFGRRGERHREAMSLPDPRQFFGSGQERSDVYDVTDGVSDEQFEDGLTAAREEANLSRANVIRKVRRRVAGETGPSEKPGSRAERVARIRELAEGNYSARQIADMVGIRDDAVRLLARQEGFEIPADKVMYRTRKHDSNRIVEETTHALDGLRMGLELVDFDALDPEKIPGWSSSLTASLRSLNQFARRIKELNPP